MKGKSISEDLAWTIVRMAPLLGLSDIEAYTSVSKAQIKWILACWWATGSVKTPRDCETRGRPRHLTPEDVNVRPILSPNLPDSSLFRAPWARNVIRIWMNYRRVYTATVESKHPYKRFGEHWKEVDTAWRRYTYHNLYTETYLQKPKLTKTAIEQSAAKHAAYMTKVGWNYTPEQMVFVDESACNRKMAYRDCTWAVWGRQAVHKAFFVRGRRYEPQNYCNNIYGSNGAYVFIF